MNDDQPTIDLGTCPVTVDANSHDFVKQAEQAGVWVENTLMPFLAYEDAKAALDLSIQKAFEEHPDK